LCATAFGVGTGLGVEAEPGLDDDVEGAVELAVAAAVEPVPDGVARGGLLRGDAGEGGEGGLRSDPAVVGVGAADDRGGDGSDAWSVCSPVTTWSTSLLRALLFSRSCLS
jgi:hypothetical protein